MRTLKISGLRFFESEKHGKLDQKLDHAHQYSIMLTSAQSPCKAHQIDSMRTLAADASPEEIPAQIALHVHFKKCMLGTAS